jgi:hypothetical protein
MILTQKKSWSNLNSFESRCDKSPKSIVALDSIEKKTLKQQTCSESSEEKTNAESSSRVAEGEKIN